MGQTVEIEVRELKPELLQDYLKFFDNAFSGSKEEVRKPDCMSGHVGRECSKEETPPATQKRVKSY